MLMLRRIPLYLILLVMLPIPDARTDRGDIDLTGQYQPCDDRVCYAPQAIAVSWTVTLKPLDRRPPG